MERDFVLAKLFSVSHNLKKNRDEHRKNAKPSEIRDKIKSLNLSISAKNTMRILLNNENINQRNIATTLSISSQAVGDIINKLETAKLVVKVSGKINNENFIKLTEEGEKVAQELDQVIKLHAKKIFSQFSDKEIDEFYHLLSKIEI